MSDLVESRSVYRRDGGILLLQVQKLATVTRGGLGQNRLGEAPMYTLKDGAFENFAILEEDFGTGVNCRQEATRVRPPYTFQQLAERRWWIQDGRKPETSQRKEAPFPFSLSCPASLEDLRTHGLRDVLVQHLDRGYELNVHVPVALRALPAFLVLPLLLSRHDSYDDAGNRTEMTEVDDSGTLVTTLRVPSSMLPGPPSFGQTDAGL